MASLKNYRQINHHNVTSVKKEDNPYYNGIVKIGCQVDEAIEVLPEPSINLLNKTYWQKSDNNIYICVLENDKTIWRQRNIETKDKYIINADENTCFDTREYYLIDVSSNPENYIEKIEYTIKPWIKNPQVHIEGINNYISNQKSKDIYMYSDRYYSYFFITPRGSDKLIKLQLSSEHNFYDFQEYQYSIYDAEIVDEQYHIEIQQIYVPVNNAFNEKAEFYLDMIINEEMV